MDARILIVDDDANLAAGMRRALHRQYDVSIAARGAEGLERLETDGPFAVVVSDLRMPGMDGIEFLRRARRHAPDTVRVMLTGHADLQTAIESVNEGHVFRFLTKPAAPETLAKVLAAAVKQYRLIIAERELLEQTLQGSVRVLTDLLSLINPTAFGRADRIHRLIRPLAERLDASNLWEIEMAARLSQVGCVTVPEAILLRAAQGGDLSTAEREMVCSHPRLAHDLLVNIPRLETVARIVAYQDKHFDGAGLPADGVAGEDIPLGARLLKVVMDYDALETAGRTPAHALAILKGREGVYDPRVRNEFENALIQLKAGTRHDLCEVSARELRGNMIFACDVTTPSGLVLVSKGQDATLPIIFRLRNFAANALVCEPLKVLVPRATG